MSFISRQVGIFIHGDETRDTGCSKKLLNTRVTWNVRAKMEIVYFSGLGALP